MEHSIRWNVSVRSRSNWSLEMLVFKERGKPENPEKSLSEQERENQQQTQPTYGVNAGVRTRATLVRDECSHHYAPLAPPERYFFVVS